MGKKLMDINALIDNDWVDFSRQTITGSGSKYRYYIHVKSDSIEIGGGPYGKQTIYPMAMTEADDIFLDSSIARLDSLIDLDFERTWNSSESCSLLFLDSKFEIGGSVLGVAVTNIEKHRQWFEIVLDGSALVDEEYRRYVYLHEYGHTLGLEHPFEESDGDSEGGNNPWTSSIFPEDTVMAYRNPLNQKWPHWFSDNDIRALVKIWGLEDDQSGSYQLISQTTGRDLMIGDPTIAERDIISGKVKLEGFKTSEREVFGSSDDDKLVGFTPQEGGWTHEWFYSGSGNDIILGGGGRDQLLGGLGDDSLRGGHGQDVCEGGHGNDEIYGGGGRNTLIPGFGEDSLFVLSDQTSHEEPEGRNHHGSLADILIGIESHDKITILGCEPEELKVIELENSFGIEARDVLEAIVIDSEITKDELISMISGDATRWF